MSYPQRFVAARLRGSIELALGLLMIPLSLVPIVLFLTKTPDGYLMYLRGRYALAAPSTPHLPAPERAFADVAFRRLPVDGVPVLVYHGIGRSFGDTTDRRFIVSRDRFAAQMRALQDAGFRAIDTGDLVSYLKSGDRSVLPRRPVLITFDDGRTDAMLQATSILHDTDLKATMFVIGSDASSASLYYRQWGPLRGYAAGGVWELQNHTYALHRMIDDVKGLRPESELVRVEPGETLAAYRARIGADLDRNARLLRQNGGASIAFSYPYGDWGQNARTPGVAAALRQVLRGRVEVAFDQDHQSGWRFALPGDDPLHVHRLQVQNWTVTDFLSRLRAAAAISETAYRERGLDVHIDRRLLVSAAVATTCAPVRAAPIAARSAAAGLVALSFDDGLSPYTPQVLDVLAQHDAHATFFVHGETVRSRTPVLARMLEAGDEIANGTWSGGHPAALDDAALALSLKRTETEVQAAVPFRPCLTRPPYNEQVARVARIARRLDLTTVLWSVAPHDQSLHDPALIARRVLRRVAPGAIVLLHDGGSARWATVQALPTILGELERRGYRVVTVSRLLTAPGPAQRRP